MFVGETLDSIEQGPVGKTNTAFQVERYVFPPYSNKKARTTYSTRR